MNVYEGRWYRLDEERNKRYFLTHMVVINIIGGSRRLDSIREENIMANLAGEELKRIGYHKPVILKGSMIPGE